MCTQRTITTAWTHTPCCSLALPHLVCLLQLTWKVAELMKSVGAAPQGMEAPKSKSRGHQIAMHLDPTHTNRRNVDHRWREVDPAKQCHVHLRSGRHCVMQPMLGML